MRVIVGTLVYLASCCSPEAQEPLRLNLGHSSPALHTATGDGWVEVVPAFEDYTYMVFDVCEALKLTDKDCLIYPMNGDLGGNAIATVEDGNKLIVYDRTLSDTIGYDGAEMVIAHEVGHHVCGHLGGAANLVRELEADAFAGAAMRQLGRSLEAALGAVELFSNRPSLSHPGRAERVEAIKEGWTHPERGRSCLGRLP
jgi:hypothetical protein